MSQHLDPEKMNSEQLLAYVYDLEAKVADLMPKSEPALRLCGTFGLTRAEAAILLMLADGAEHSVDALSAAAGANPFSDREKTMSVHVSRLRKKVAPAGVRIVNVYGYGYRMAEGADVVQKAAGEKHCG